MQYTDGFIEDEALGLFGGNHSQAAENISGFAAGPEPTRCPCEPCSSERLLWEEELHKSPLKICKPREAGEKCVGWLALYRVAGTVHTENGHGNPRLGVKLNDRTIPAQERSRVSHVSDITASPLGQWIIKAWIALNPSSYAALLKTHQEWLDDERRMAWESITTEVEDSGIKVAGLSDQEIAAHWNNLRQLRHRAWLEKEGWPPEESSRKMDEYVGECRERARHLRSCR
jgi:hypothetical protein